jgi:hypothetical protein
MGFGIKEWEPWVSEGEEAIEVIKAAFAAGINVCRLPTDSIIL